MYLVFDVGGTHTRLALSKDGRSLERVTRFDTDPGPAGFETFLRSIEDFRKAHKLKRAVGGLVSHRDSHGRQIAVPNLPGWDGVPVVEKLETRLGVPVQLENDAALAGLGEATRGAGQGSAIVVYITVSTGVNGTRIVNGRIDRSAQGFEIGRMLMADETGALKSFEDLVSGAALARKYHDLPQHVRNPEVWAREARYLALGLYNTLLHWSPDTVVYGGPMIRDVHVDVIAQELAALPPVFKRWPSIKRAELGDDAGLYGSLELISQLEQIDL